MNFRINANSCKNAMGTVFLLAAAFFVCSTFVSMRSVFADPIAPANTLPQKSGRASPRANATSRASVARSTTSRATAKPAQVASRATTSRVNAANRTVTSRGTAGARGVSVTTAPTTTRGVTARNQSATVRSKRAVRARTATTPSRVSATGSMMAGTRASSTSSYSYLASSLYTGSYANIIDSSTGLISADAYANCMESYYTCMDEICTARSDTKGRCSCAGRATNFLSAESALEKANEELIRLSGQLSLLIATKGKGEDLSYAFSLTDAEKVMNCVSYKEEVQGKQITDAEWYEKHPMVDANGSKVTSGLPSYCKESGNNFGFDVSNIDGSSSDILAQLQAWAKAKDLAKEYTVTNNDNLLGSYTTVSGVVNALAGVSDTDTADADLDSLANKWGYDLFQYAHNNVCGRVLDSCFNGIYEACGTPKSITENEKTVRVKCANGATSNCPFNYNSFISVDTDGEVKLSDRSNTDATVNTSASCFGYTTTTTTTTRSGTTTTTTDPYASLRGPVADARRSIMQKYLLDANAACDVYGNALKQTAQNINYQKIAAEQALQQKRLEFKQEEASTTLANATAAIDNFNDCLSEILDCYESQANNTNSTGAYWTDARIKTYCAQVAQVPHCYETMICNPSTAQFHAVIDKADNTRCFNSQDYTLNTCRNIVTISEILNPAYASAGNIAPEEYGNSAAMREQCLIDAGIEEIRGWTRETASNVACTVAELRALEPNAAAGYKTSNASGCEYVTRCNSGYTLVDNECILASTDCTSEIEGAAYATRTLQGSQWGACELKTCKENYSKSPDGKKCVADTSKCYEDDLVDNHATAGYRLWDGSDWSACNYTACYEGYVLYEGLCTAVYQDCTSSITHASVAWREFDTARGIYGTCTLDECEEGYTASSRNTCISDSETGN